MRSEARAALFALAVVGAACTRRDPPAPRAEPVVVNAPGVSSAPPGASTAPSAASAPAVPGPARELTWKYPDTAAGPMSVVVSIPASASAERYPVLIAMHGRGEAFKG